MRRPKAVRVFGKWIPVRYKTLDTDTLGTWCSSRREIVLDPDQHKGPTHLSSTLCHEVRHAAWDLAGYRHNEDFKAWEESYQEALDNGLGDIFSVNPSSKDVRWEDVVE